MARKMTEWPSKRGSIAKIMPSDGCKGDTVPLAVGRWYDFPQFGGYLGNVGLSVRGRQRRFAPVAGKSEGGLSMMIRYAVRALLPVALVGLALAPAAAQQMYVYPAQNQSPDQQNRDQYECHQWSVQQTGVDPTTQSVAGAPPPQGGPRPVLCAVRPAARQSVPLAAPSRETPARVPRLGRRPGRSSAAFGGAIRRNGKSSNGANTSNSRLKRSVPITVPLRHVCVVAVTR